MENRASMGGTLKEFKVQAHGPGEFLVTIKIETQPISCDESVQVACWMFMIKDDVFLELVTDMRLGQVPPETPWELIPSTPPRVVGGSVKMSLWSDLRKLGDGSLTRFWWE